jgi:hypothetical protein
MNAEQIYIVHAANAEQRNFLRSVFKLHKIRFEVAGESDSPYDKEFTDTVLRAEESIRQGRGTKVSSEQFDALWK